MKKQTAWMIMRLLLVMGAVAAVLWATAFIFSLTYPFWIAAFFAWLLKPLSTFLQTKLRFPAGIAAVTTLLVGISVIGGIITGITFLVIDPIQRFAERAPAIMEDAFYQIQDFLDTTILPLWQQISGIADGIGGGGGLPEIGAEIGAGLSRLAQSAGDAAAQLALSIPAFLVALLFVLIAIYFIGKDWGRMSGGIRKALPDQVVLKAKEFYKAMWVRVFGYIKAQLILMCITGIIVFIGLLVLQVDNAVLLALIIGLAEFLPYLGTGTILIPWGLYLIITGNLGLGVSLIILYVIILVVRQAVEPKVLSSSMNLNPIAVLVSLFAGLQLFGALGFIIGPVILVVIVICIDIGVFKALNRFIREGFV